jgi:hypothetical protein
VILQAEKIRAAVNGLGTRAISRRAWLQSAGCGFGYLALAGMAAGESQHSLAAKVPTLPPRAKRIIFLFMQGGPSHVDTFDYKPALLSADGQRKPFDDARVLANTGMRGSTQRLMKPLWEFQQHGESGQWVSGLFPEMARHVDDLCFVHSLHTEGVAHGPATLFLHCGATNFVRPSMGSWILYGLGTENANLPGFISLGPSAGNGGPRNYGAAFLPAIYQGTAVGKPDDAEPVIRNLASGAMSRKEQRRQLDFLQALNVEQASRREGDSRLEAVIDSYERGWRMQSHAPDVLDLAQETAATLATYGIGQDATDAFGRKCLMARRLCESGVRFIQVTYGDNSANPAWDQHSDMPKHADHALAVDKPIAGLLEDLKQRGLLEDTLVWWGGEFGRTPYAQGNGTGRDHNPGGFTMWLAGGGVRAGTAHGATDEFGHQAIENKVHMHDLHATILHQLGLDHERLTYSHAGRNFRLTDVHGRVVQGILA